jgi:hypothetical protein
MSSYKWRWILTTPSPELTRKGPIVAVSSIKPSKIMAKPSEVVVVQRLRCIRYRCVKRYIPQFVGCIWHRLIDPSNCFHTHRMYTIRHPDRRHADLIPVSIQITLADKHTIGIYLLDLKYMPDPFIWTIKDQKVRICGILRRLLWLVKQK